MSECRFVQDGEERWWNGAATEVRSEVVASFAERLQKATRWQRVWLTWEIERQVQQRLKCLPGPSREALF